VPENTMRVNVEEHTSFHSRRDEVALIYATFPDAATADRIGGELVMAGLAACVNVIPGMRSIYRWAGAIQRDDEVVGIVKTRAALAGRVIGWVRVSHPYVNPAAIVLPVSGGSADFLAWIAEETTGAGVG
jgi:periplasmic divalent cation tolerance protein